MNKVHVTKNMDSSHRECDVAFIVALPEEVDNLDILVPAGRKRVPNEHCLEIQSCKLDTATGNKLSCLVLLLNDMGPTKAAINTTNFLNFTTPTLLVVLGLSGRISLDCKLGSVVVASSCDDPFYRAKMTHSKVIPGGRERFLDVLSSPIAAWLNMSKPHLSYYNLSEKDKLLLKKQGYIDTAPPSVICGPICTTSFLIDDPEFPKWLKDCRNRNILAADMESAAIVEAAHSKGILDGRVLVIRGISDPADGMKKETDNIEKGILRQIAMRNASHVASHIISNALQFSNGQVMFRNSDDPSTTDSLAA